LLHRLFLHARSDHEEKIVHGQKKADQYKFFLNRQFPPEHSFLGLFVLRGVNFNLLALAVFLNQRDGIGTPEYWLGVREFLVMSYGFKGAQA
jgi:hypothetical protein